MVYVYTCSEYAGLMGYEPVRRPRPLCTLVRLQATTERTDMRTNAWDGTQCEVVGLDVATVIHPDDVNTRDGVLASLSQPPVPSGVGPIFSLRPVVRCKDRSLLPIFSRHQYLYDSEGRVRPITAHA
jgi:hypothetical protein